MRLAHIPHRLLLLQLLFCFIVQGVPTLETALDQNLASVFAYRAVHSVTLCPVETMNWPIKNTLPWPVRVFTFYYVFTTTPTSGNRNLVLRNVFMVDQAGVEPASRTLFSLLLTAITLLYTYS